MGILFATLGISVVILIIATMIFRYRNKIEKEIVEDSNKEWNKNYSLTIDPYVPNDKVRKAIASNMKSGKETRRKAYKSSGTPSNRYSSDPYVSTHGIIWDVIGFLG